MLSIAIAGAGPAGLTLARLLQVQSKKHNIPSNALEITLFESDAHLNARTEQVGTLDLHLETGLAAVKAAGLWEEFQKHARYDAEELVIADKNGTEVVHMMPEQRIAGVEETRPEIDRQKLMEVLLKSVMERDDEGYGSGSEDILKTTTEEQSKSTASAIDVTISWGKKLVRVDDSSRMLHFQDQSSAGPFDLIVGADGAWSKVRALLTPEKPQYAGICGFETVIENPATRCPQIDKLLGPGSYFVYSDCKGLMSHRLANGNFKVNYWRTNEELFAKNIWDACNGEEKDVSRVVEEWFTTWRPEFRDCVKASSKWRHRALYELPVGHMWEHVPGFTMLGDAAHLMTPFAGKGLNAAMKDALLLSNHIIACLRSISPTSTVSDAALLDKAVLAYETEMFPLQSKVQTESMFNKTHMFRADAPIGFMVDMMDVIFTAKGKDLNKGLLWWLPIKKSVWFVLQLKTWAGEMRRWISG